MSVDGRMALRRALLAAVLGGAAAVGAEVVFTRELALLFGVTAPAAATVVSVYLGGMALGSVLGGRLADRAGDRAGWVYVIAELAAGAWAWLFPVFFAIAWDLLDARGGGLIETGLVTVVLVGPAAVASGATFPGLTRAVGQGPAIRWLYGANALGAALGGVGVGLYLPEWLGFSGSLGAAGLLSVMAAVVLGVSTRGEAPAEVSVASDPDPVSPRLAGTMQAVIGGVGMASEIGWTRILEQTGPNPGSLCFPIVLAAYLVGLALGTVVLAPVLARLGERRGLGMGALLAALGPLLGAEVRRRHEAHGVRFFCENGLFGLVGDPGVERVILTSGVMLECDVLVVAIGSDANTEWLEGSGLDASDGVLVNGGMQAVRADGQVLENVYAVGDVARYPNPLFDEVARRVEHWNLPTETGKRAGQVLAAHLRGDDCAPIVAAPFSPLPSFWSDQYDMHLLAFGMTYLAERSEVVAGRLDDECVVEYFRGDELVGVCGIGMRGAIQGYRSRFTAPVAAH